LTCEEWQKSYPDPSENTSRPIQLEFLIAAVGRSADQSEIVQDMNDSEAFQLLIDQGLIAME